MKNRSAICTFRKLASSAASSRNAPNLHNSRKNAAKNKPRPSTKPLFNMKPPSATPNPSPPKQMGSFFQFPKLKLTSNAVRLIARLSYPAPPDPPPRGIQWQLPQLNSRRTHARPTYSHFSAVHRHPVRGASARIWRWNGQRSPSSIYHYQKQSLTLG